MNCVINHILQGAGAIKKSKMFMSIYQNRFINRNVTEERKKSI